MTLILFAQTRSGGSFIADALSGGGTILTEPLLPVDAADYLGKENEGRARKFRADCAVASVAKVVDFGFYLDLGEPLPEGRHFVLFRHPFAQIASTLFTWHDWADRWCDKSRFWEAIEAWKRHFALAQRLRHLDPETGVLKYEDALANLTAFVRKVRPGQVYLDHANKVKRNNYKLGPEAEGGEWKPSEYALLEKEKTWIWERLRPEMEALGYAR